MGLKSSKETKFSRRRFSTKRRYKRHSPEGEPSCAPPNNTSKDLCHHNCPCTIDHSSQRYNDPFKINLESKQSKIDSSFGLQVAMPVEDSSSKSEASTCQTTTPISKWSLTFETSNKKLSDLMSSLHPHIESVELDGQSGERRNIRVRFRDSLDLGAGGQFPPQLRAALRPDQQTSSESVHTSRVGNAAHDRNQHYEQIPGAAGKSTTELPASANGADERCGSSCERPSASRSRSRDRPNCCRRHSGCCANRGNAKSGRYQSPFDQRSFQEAMLLRLTELKRKSALHADAARGGMESSNSSDNEVQLRDGSDSEYSGDEDNHVTSSASPADCSRLFQPLSTLELLSQEPDCDRRFSKDSNCHTLLQHRHQVATSTTITNDRSVMKPWDKPTEIRQTGKKKNLTKKRGHGYLRASAAAQKGEVTFPNTPKSSSKLERGAGDPVTIQRHQHEHIHHHYFYNFKSDT